MWLVGKFPPDQKFVLVGDLIDRGPKSAQVVDWAWQNKHRAIALKGNHEDMMVDFYRGTKRYDPEVWFENGGTAPRDSYRGLDDSEYFWKHLGFLETRPLYFEDENHFITHAPINPRFSFDDVRNPKDKETETSIIWNRSAPVEREKIQIFGHNSHWGLQIFKRTNETAPAICKSSVWGICLDQSQGETLTAFDTETKMFHVVPYDYPKHPAEIVSDPKDL